MAREVCAQVKLTGDRNCCPTCAGYFNSSAAFDMHRTGTFTPPARRCLSVPEMLAAGMVVNTAGFWVTKAYPGDLGAKMAPSVLRRPANGIPAAGEARLPLEAA